MRIKADLRNLIDNQPTTVLTATLAVGGTTLTVANNAGFSNNDYLLLGKLGDEKTEIVKIGAAVSAGTSITTGACVSTHDEDTPVIKIDFNQVRFYQGSTNVAADSTALATAQVLDPTDIFNYKEDSTNSTGYGFIRFYNSTTTGYSDYSDAIPYTGYTSKMLRQIRKKVRRLISETDELNSPVSNEEIDEEINLAQKEIAHDRLWSFYEKTKSFSTVANQYEYTLASDVYVLYDAKFDTQPLAATDLHRWNILRWDSDITGDPTHICMWRKKAMVYPYPSDSADTTTLGAAITTTTGATITVVSTADFQSQGRIIIDSEVIAYTGKTSTTFTGCVRGEEETTAATHLIAATVAERDVIYHFQEEPADLTDELNSPVSNEEIDEEINLAQKEIAHDRLWSFYEKTKSFSTVANQYEYTLASDVYVLYDAKFDTQPLAATDLHRWNILRWDSDITGDPTHICMWRKKAMVYPYPSDSADTTTLGAAITTTTGATITVVSTADFQSQGRIIIDSEVIAYTGKTSTTFTGCVRGEEETTAATHLIAATVAERDVIYHFQEEPADLTDETDETQISEPSVIAYKSGAELSLNLDKQELHDRLMFKYERAMAQLRRVDEPKIKSCFGRVKDISQVVSDYGITRNPNDYPSNISS